LRMFVLAVTKFLFYLYGWLWTLRPKRVGLMRDVLALFYLGFLGLDERDVEVVKLDDFELITRCRNPCPILRLSLMLKIDTKLACKIFRSQFANTCCIDLTHVWLLKETIII